MYINVYKANLPSVLSEKKAVSLGWKKKKKEIRKRWQTLSSLPRPKEKLSARSSVSHLCDSQSLTSYARDLIRESTELEAEDATTCPKGPVINFVPSGDTHPAFTFVC